MVCLCVCVCVSYTPGPPAIICRPIRARGHRVDQTEAVIWLMGAGPTREGEESALREPVDFLSVSHINHIAKCSVNTGDL